MDLIDGIRNLKREHGQDKPLDNLILEAFSNRDKMVELMGQVCDLANRMRYLEFIIGTDRKVDG